MIAFKLQDIKNPLFEFIMLKFKHQINEFFYFEVEGQEVFIKDFLIPKNKLYENNYYVIRRFQQKTTSSFQVNYYKFELIYNVNQKKWYV